LLSPSNIALCEALGRELAEEDGVVLVTGGLRHLGPHPDRLAGEWILIHAAVQHLRKLGIAPETRIETMLPEPDDERFVRFHEGNVQVLRNRSRQARRFAMGNVGDAMLTVQGHTGVTQMIDLALGLEKPCLLLPFTGGASRERWSENRDLIRGWFELDSKEVALLENARPDDMSSEEVTGLARTVVQILLRRLRPKCFVMMPFHTDFDRLYAEGVRPAVAAAGFNPVRADHLNLVGNAVEVLRTAIHACDCAVAVLTRFNVNVVYELGFAHALGKPVVLLCEWGEGRRLPELPFDLRNETVLGHDSDLGALREKLTAVLKQVGG
jgi:hypothetical protein